MTNEEIIWNYLTSEIGNDYGVAGLMGNIYAESGLNPINMENQYEKKLGFTDATYTEAVDNGTYTNFTGDCCGYGLCQWTYSTRKRGLLDLAKRKKKSVGDINVQLEWLFKELKKSYKHCFEVLKNATSVQEASDVVMVEFERPADQSQKAKDGRALIGQKYYDKYAGKKADISANEAKPAKKTISYQVTTSRGLNVRKKAGTDYAIVAQMQYKHKFEVAKIEKTESEGEWGYIPALKGWSCLAYAERI